jgi:alkylation response protein AidB-like acyl-CoA dehydrogenase
MEFEFSQEDKVFREEVRDWLSAHIPREKRPPEGPQATDFDKAWQRVQYDGGWAGLDWPVEYGGRGLPLIQQMIWMEEYARSNAPAVGNLYVGLNHGGPTLIACGTEAQKTFHLQRILTGESVWCQGFSEPGAGSDLAGLRTKAVVDGNHLVVTGSKIWTSYAQYADYQELLVRTGQGDKKHDGITWVICDMKAPGITIRPIIDFAGHHHLNQVFYDEVRLPLANVVGKIDGGWKVAMSTLGFERGTGMVCLQLAMARCVEDLIVHARETSGPAGRPLIRDEEIAARLATLRAEVSALRAMTYMNISRHQRGGAGLEGTMTALYHAELEKRVARAALDIGAADSLELHPAASDWPHAYLLSFPMTIAGGTSEIRRNIIGERVLGLPR